MAMFGLVLLGALNRGYDAENTRGVWQKPDIIALSSLFFWSLLGGFWAINTSSWFGETKSLLPLFGLPLCFFWLPTLTTRAYYGIYACLVLLISVACITTLIDYFAHPAYYISLLGTGAIH